MKNMMFTNLLLVGWHLDVRQADFTRPIMINP